IASVTVLLSSHHIFYLFSFFLVPCYFLFFFFFNDTATTEIYTLSLHDALPISCASSLSSQAFGCVVIKAGLLACGLRFLHLPKALLQWHFADSSHIQWRDRAGIKPASLLTHVLRHKHLYEWFSYSVSSFHPASKSDRFAD